MKVMTPLVEKGTLGQGNELGILLYIDLRKWHLLYFMTCNLWSTQITTFIVGKKGLFFL